MFVTDALPSWWHGSIPIASRCISQQQKKELRLHLKEGKKKKKIKTKDRESEESGQDRRELSWNRGEKRRKNRAKNQKIGMKKAMYTAYVQNLNLDKTDSAMMKFFKQLLTEIPPS